MINPAMYHKARKSKIQEMKRMMHEMIASGDDGPMDHGKVADVMEEAGENPQEEVMESPAEELSEHDDSGDTATPAHKDAFDKAKHDYFKPKMKPSRPGTAILIGNLSSGPKKPSHGGGKSFGKKA